MQWHNVIIIHLQLAARAFARATCLAGRGAALDAASSPDYRTMDYLYTFGRYGIDSP